MISKRLADKCITHSHGCDCREYRISQLVKDLIDKINLYYKETGGKYVGGKLIQSLEEDIKKLGLK